MPADSAPHGSEQWLAALLIPQDDAGQHDDVGAAGRHGGTAASPDEKPDEKTAIGKTEWDNGFQDPDGAPPPLDDWSSQEVDDDPPPLPDPQRALIPVVRKAVPPRVVPRGTPSSASSAEPQRSEPENPLLAVAAEGRPPTDPDSALRWMNKRHAVVLEGGKARVLMERRDEELDRPLIVRCGFPDFRYFYANRNVYVPGKNGKGQRQRLADWWLTHPSRRTYEAVTFAPNKETPGLFNLWQGFGVVPAPGDWTRMKAHLAEIICANVASVLRWLMAWMADAVQHPERCAEVAVVLRGVRGSGKGVLVRSFGQLFGAHFVHVSNPRHLIGNFNAHLQNALVVFADEAFLAGDRQGEGVLKMLITEPNIPIERKGHDVVFARNRIHLLIASNDQWIVPAGHDERRFAVLDVAADHAQDHRYFAALEEQLQHGGFAAMLHDLLTYDYSDVNLRKPPTTAALFDQKLHSMDAVTRWWFDKLMTGRILSSLYPADEDWPSEIPRHDLRQDYMATIKDIGTRTDRSTETELGIKFKSLLPPGFPRDTKRRFPGSEKAVRLYGLPSLTECREHFARTYLQPDFSWPSTQDEPASYEAQPVVIRLDCRNRR
jgi:hypothetical protein